MNIALTVWVIDSAFEWLMLAAGILAILLGLGGLWEYSDAAIATAAVVAVLLILISTISALVDYAEHGTCETFSEQSGYEITRYSPMYGCYVRTPDGVFEMDQTHVDLNEGGER